MIWVLVVFDVSPTSTTKRSLEHRRGLEWSSWENLVLVECRSSSTRGRRQDKADLRCIGVAVGENITTCGEVANKLEALVCEVQERDMDLNDESHADAMPFCAREAYCASQVLGTATQSYEETFAGSAQLCRHGRPWQTLGDTVRTGGASQCGTQRSQPEGRVLCRLVVGEHGGQPGWSHFHEKRGSNSQR